MPRVIPSGGSDQTAFFMARNAAADDALTRLYMTLLARKEDRDRNEAFQREMLGMRHGHRMQELDRMYGPPMDPSNPTKHPFGSPGAQPDPLAQPPAQAAPQAPLPPRPGDPPAGGFLPGANMPPSADKFSALQGDDGDVLPPNAQLAQGRLPAGGITEFSSQSVTKPTMPNTRKLNTQDPGTMKYQYPQRRPTRGPVEFQEMHPTWVQAMDQAEKKYGLPNGALMTLYGYENAGGAFLGKNPTSSANGLFQFTDAVRKQFGISDQDVLNPGVMIEAAAKNLRHNANAYKQLSGKDLPNDPRAMPYWIALHQWGATDGSRLVHAALSDAGHMGASDVMLKSPKRDNYSTLVNNGIPGNARVSDVIQRITEKAVPWFDSSIKMRSQLGGSTGSNAPFPQQPTGTNNPSGRMNNPPDHPSISGVNPRLVAAVRGGATLALPPGYTIRATSGHRPGDHGSHHARRNASDWQIYQPNGVPIPNQGEDTTGLYARVARGVKTWASENDPALLPHIGYGGAFDKSRNSPTGVPDLMHFDLGGANRGRLRPDVMFANLKPLAANERNAPTQGQQQQQQPQQPVRVASATPQAYPPLKPSEAYSPLRDKQPAGAVDPTTQFGVRGVEPRKVTTERVGPTTAAPQVAAPVAPSTVAPPQADALPPGWTHGKLSNGAPFLRDPKGGVQLAPKGWVPPSSTPTVTEAPTTLSPSTADVPIPRPRPAEANAMPFPPTQYNSGGASFVDAAQGKSAERQMDAMLPQIPMPRSRPADAPQADIPLPRGRPIEADTGAPVSLYGMPTQDDATFQSPTQGPTPEQLMNVPSKGQFPDDPSWFSITPRGYTPPPDPFPLPTPTPAPPPNVASMPPPRMSSREVVPPAWLEDPSTAQAGSVEPLDPNNPNPDPLPLPELPPIQMADRPEDAELYTGPVSTAAPMRDANDANAGVSGAPPFNMPPPNVNGSTQGWKPYGATSPEIPNVANAEKPKPSVQEMVKAIFSGQQDIGLQGVTTPHKMDEVPQQPAWLPDLSKYLPDRLPNRGDIPSLNTTNEMIYGAGRKLFLEDTRGDRQKQFDSAMQDWVQKHVKDPVIGKVTGAVDELKRSYNSGQPSGWDMVKKQMQDWYYGPKKVKTETIGAPKVNAPTTLSKPNGPASTGVPLPKQPPLVLEPKKGAPANPFQGPVVMPGGNVAPPIGNAAGARGAKTMPGGGIPRVPDPTSPTGYKYLTPEEIQQQQQPQVVEEPQVVE